MRIALFQPDIPQNTGNILRLAACLDIEVDIIEPIGFFMNDKKFLRSAMDYINIVKYKKHIDWDTFYSQSINAKNRIILLTTKSKEKYYNFFFKKNDILLFGCETSGVPSNIHNLVEYKLTIPMKDGLRSINLSSAVSLVVGEACRQLKLF